jgi:hypothetical protein
MLDEDLARDRRAASRQELEEILVSERLPERS